VSYAHSLQIHGPECGVFGRSRHRCKCGSRQYQCDGDGRQQCERFPITRPRSRGSPTLHCDAGPQQRNTAADPRWGIWELRRPERQRQLLFEARFRSRAQLAGKFNYQWPSDFDANVNLHPYTSGLGPCQMNRTTQLVERLPRAPDDPRNWPCASPPQASREDLIARKPPRPFS
jgi:hypothetical protein